MDDGGGADDSVGEEEGSERREDGVCCCNRTVDGQEEPDVPAGVVGERNVHRRSGSAQEKTLIKRRRFMI